MEKGWNRPHHRCVDKLSPGLFHYSGSLFLYLRSSRVDVREEMSRPEKGRSFLRDGEGHRAGHARENDLHPGE